VNTLVFLAAACVTGQVAQPQSIPPLSACPVVAAQQDCSGCCGCSRSWHYQSPVTACPPEQPSCWQRLREWWGQLFHQRRACCEPCATCRPVPTIPVAPVPIKTLPQQYLPVPVAIQLPPVGVNRRFQDKIGHEDDYSWITGQLHYIHADGGLWIVRYATVDVEDKFGGSVVLASAVDMHNFREGDLVSVHGEILKQERACHASGGALYRVVAIDMIDRAD
jgi:hypothetical protein